MSDQEWRALILGRLDKHDHKLDKLLECVASMKVKVAVGSALIAGIVSLLVKHLA